MNFIWSESAKWLLSSSVRKIPGALITPMGTPIALIGKWPWRCTSTGQDSSNELDLDWIGLVVTEFRIRRDSPYHAHGHAHYVLMGKCPWRCMYMYSPRQFQWTWSGVNRPSGCRVLASARFQEPLSRPWARPLYPSWANDHDVAHLHAKTVPKNLIWSASAKWLLSSSVRKIPGALIPPMGTPIMPPWANDMT